MSPANVMRGERVVASIAEGVGWHDATDGWRPIEITGTNLGAKVKFLGGPEGGLYSEKERPDAVHYVEGDEPIPLFLDHFLVFKKDVEEKQK